MTAIAVIVCVVGLLVSAAALSDALSFRKDRPVIELARELSGEGARSSASVDWPPGAHLDSAPVASFMTERGLVTAPLIAYESDDGSNVPVLYLADSPADVMATSDVEAYAQRSFSEDLAVAGAGVTPLILLVVIWLVSGRSDWLERVERWIPSSLAP